MKLALISVIFFQLVFLGCSLPEPSRLSNDESGYQLIVERVRAERKYLTRVLALESEFSADDERNVRLLYKRFPKGTSTASIEADLRGNEILDEAAKISFEKKSNDLLVQVSFISGKPAHLETKYTFTFKGDNNGYLIEEYYLTEHF